MCKEASMPPRLRHSEREWEARAGVVLARVPRGETMRPVCEDGMNTLPTNDSMLIRFTHTTDSIGEQ